MSKFSFKKVTISFCLFLSINSSAQVRQFMMFSTAEREIILRNFKEIVTSNRFCTEFPLEKIVLAAKGMFIHPASLLKSMPKEELCAAISEANLQKKEPIVHEDSLTAWGNRAAEEYGLDVNDIINMKEGQELKIIILDRNIGSYLDGNQAGTTYSPSTKGVTYAIYTHKQGLAGKLNLYELGVVFEKFVWEVNLPSLDETLQGFWGPIPKTIAIAKLNPKVKVGWQGPAIRFSDTAKLPSSFTHYDTWWDDYLPFRTHNFLKIGME